MFFWARLTGAQGAPTDAGVFAKKAIEKLVAFVPGKPFYATQPDTATFRLSFATADAARIEEGIHRLGQALA
jgi:DNA-binding transcriptional MocR family regulator